MSETRIIGATVEIGSDARALVTNAGDPFIVAGLAYITVADAAGAAALLVAAGELAALYADEKVAS